MEEDFAPRYDRVNSEYLKNLAAVEARLPLTSPLRQQIGDLKLKLATDAPGGGGRKLTNRNFDHTEWLWQADRDKVWKFLPGGKITTDTGVAHHFGWKILGPDTFMITIGGGEGWKLTMDFDTMRAEGAHVKNPDDKKEPVFKRKAPRR